MWSSDVCCAAEEPSHSFEQQPARLSVRVLLPLRDAAGRRPCVFVSDMLCLPAARSSFGCSLCPGPQPITVQHRSEARQGGVLCRRSKREAHVRLVYLLEKRQSEREQEKERKRSWYEVGSFIWRENQERRDKLRRVWMQALGISTVSHSSYSSSSKLHMTIYFTNRDLIWLWLLDSLFKESLLL